LPRVLAWSGPTATNPDEPVAAYIDTISPLANMWTCSYRPSCRERPKGSLFPARKAAGPTHVWEQSPMAAVGR